MNDELSDDIKKFILPLSIELEGHKEKVFRNTPVSPNRFSNSVHDFTQYSCVLFQRESVMLASLSTELR